MAKDIKARILATALELFSKNGYAGTNIRELSASLELVKSAMYKHFESKEEIWNTLLDEMIIYYDTHFGCEGLADRKGKECTMIENEHIKIYPARREKMERFIIVEKDDELKKAYCEMLEGCLAHPDQWDWYAMWMIEKTDGTHIGDLCFKGLKEDGNPEIGYGILNEFQGQGYATEAVKLALKWAFDHPDVAAVEAESDPDNLASQRVLKKCGFQATGEFGEEGPRFIVYRSKVSNE